MSICWKCYIVGVIAGCIGTILANYLMHKNAGTITMVGEGDNWNMLFGVDPKVLSAKRSGYYRVRLKFLKMPAK